MILASSSPRRRELLHEIGLNPRVIPADIDERALPEEKPVELVERLACAKAHAVLAGGCACAPGEHIIAADTVVWLDGVCLGKPHNAADARRMLELLSGRVHYVSTGVCCCAAPSTGSEPAAERSFCETTAVEFWPLSVADIEHYLACGEYADKAGAYGIQGMGRLLVRRIDGDYFNVVGLPVARLWRELILLDEAR